MIWYGNRQTIYKIDIYKTKLCNLNIRTTANKEVGLGCRRWKDTSIALHDKSICKIRFYVRQTGNFICLVISRQSKIINCKKLWLVNDCKRKPCTRELLILVVERVVYLDASCRWIGAIIQFIITTDLTNAADRKIGTFAEIQPRPREISVKYLSLGRECEHKLFL